MLRASAPSTAGNNKACDVHSASHAGHMIAVRLSLALISFAVALSEIVVVTVPATDGSTEFIGRCSLLTYTVGDERPVGAVWACSDFLLGMARLATDRGETPPIIIDEDTSSITSGALTLAVVLTCGCSLASIVAFNHHKAHDLVTLIAAVGCGATVYACASAEHVSRIHTIVHSGQTCTVGIGMWAMVVVAGCNMAMMHRKPKSE